MAFVNCLCVPQQVAPFLTAAGGSGGAQPSARAMVPPSPTPPPTCPPAAFTVMAVSRHSHEPMRREPVPGGFHGLRHKEDDA